MRDKALVARSEAEGEERGGDWRGALETVDEMLEQHGPFLPYTWLFGRPAGTNDFPYWTNLLQKGVYGFEYWAEHVTSALPMATVGLESLMRTSSPRQVKFLALTPDAYGIPLRDSDYWLGIYYDGGDASDKPEWTWRAGWQRVLEEFRLRRREGKRGPEHWVVLLIGVNPGLLEETSEGGVDLRTWLEEGPMYAMWPVIVEAYAKWRTWATYRASKRFWMLGRWSQEHHKEVATDVLPVLSDVARLHHLAPNTALLLAGFEHMEVVLPQCTWPWRGILWSRDPQLFQSVLEGQRVPNPLQNPQKRPQSLLSPAGD